MRNVELKILMVSHKTYPRKQELCDRLLLNWRDSLCVEFEDFVRGSLAARADAPGGRITLYPFLKAMPAESYVDVMLNEVQFAFLS